MKAKLLLIALLMVGMSFAWWDASWTKKAPITVTITTTSTDFQIGVNVTYAAGMQADFEDIRFINSSENSVLNFYLQEKSDSNWAYYWVLGNWSSAGGVQAYLYYSNAGAAAGGSAIGTLFSTATVTVGSTASTDNIPGTNYIFGSPITVTSSAGYTPYKLKTLGINEQATGTAAVLQLGLYNTSASAPTTRVAGSEVFSAGTTGWRDISANASYQAVPTLSNNTVYWQGIVSDTGYIFVYMNNAAGTSHYKNLGAALTLTTPLAGMSSFTRTYNERIIFYERKWLATEPSMSIGSSSSSNCTAPAINNDWWASFDDNCELTTYKDLGTGRLMLTGGPGNFTLKAALRTASRSMTCGTAPCYFVMWPTLWFG